MAEDARGFDRSLMISLPSPPTTLLSFARNDKSSPDQGEDSSSSDDGNSFSGKARYAIIYPKRTSLKRRLRVKDQDSAFLDFVKTLLLVDPNLR